MSVSLVSSINHAHGLTWVKTNTTCIVYTPHPPNTHTHTLTHTHTCTQNHVHALAHTTMHTSRWSTHSSRGGTHPSCSLCCLHHCLMCWYSLRHWLSPLQPHHEEETVSVIFRSRDVSRWLFPTCLSTVPYFDCYLLLVSQSLLRYSFPSV